MTRYRVRNILARLCVAPDDSQPLGALVSMHPSTVWPARRIPRLLSYLHFLSRNYTFSP